MRYVLSISFGKDSLALFLRLLEERYPLDEVIFYDTGMEFSSIYHNRDLIKARCNELNIIYTELTPANPFLYDMLEREVHKKDGSIKYGYEWCGGCTRWGTSAKLTALKKHYQTYGSETVVEYIGIASDERQRINRDRQSNTVKLYPLIEWEMKEADCLKYCYDRGYNWNENGVELYSILDRVSCWCCANKNLKELKNIHQHLPEYWERLKDLQSKIDRPFKKSGSVYQLEDRFINEELEDLIK